MLTEALKEFAEEFPQLMRPLIEERDEYMVFLLRTLATRSVSCPLADNGRRLIPCTPSAGSAVTGRDALCMGGWNSAHFLAMSRTRKFASVAVLRRQGITM